jgi:Ca2+-binding EF-hand superfamily protein
MFDKDGSGKITKAEMELGLVTLGLETDKQRSIPITLR